MDEEDIMVELEDIMMDEEDIMVDEKPATHVIPTKNLRERGNPYEKLPRAGKSPRKTFD